METQSQDPSERRQFHRLRELLRASPGHGRLIEALLEALAQKSVAAVVESAPDERPWHERLTELLRRCQQAFRAECVGLWLAPQPGGAPVLFESVGLSPAQQERWLRLPTRQGFLPYEALRRGQLQQLRAPSFAKPCSSPHALPANYVCVPLRTELRTVGVLLLGAEQPVLNVEPKSLMELGRHLAAVLAQASHA